MPTDLIRFPGDLITADLWNKMLGLIDGLNGRIDAQEALDVPDVVGDLVLVARGEIAVAQLALNNVFDVEGTKGNPDDAALAGRIVIAQMPAPEAKVPVGSRVTLLITAPKVVNPNAPAITPVASGGVHAQVGKPLDITGTNFTGVNHVIIRGTQLLRTQFDVRSETLIQIASVPPFAGSPAPGTTKDILITVGNNVGDGSAIVTFFEPAIPAVMPTVTNVRLFDATTLRVIGSHLVQSGQRTSVTMGGQVCQILAQSESSLIIPMPAPMVAAFSPPPLAPGVFDLLLALDARDALRVTITTITRYPSHATDVAAAPVQPLALARAGVIDSGFWQVITTTTTMKLFLTMSLDLANKSQFGNPKVSGNTVLLSDYWDNPIFGVDVTRLDDFTIVVTVGDKSTSFVVKFGSVPDQDPGGPRGGGGMSAQ